MAKLVSTKQQLHYLLIPQYHNHRIHGTTETEEDSPTLVAITNDDPLADVTHHSLVDIGSFSISWYCWRQHTRASSGSRLMNTCNDGTIELLHDIGNHTLGMLVGERERGEYTK